VSQAWVWEENTRKSRTCRGEGRAPRKPLSYQPCIRTTQWDSYAVEFFFTPVYCRYRCRYEVAFEAEKLTSSFCVCNLHNWRAMMQVNTLKFHEYGCPHQDVSQNSNSHTRSTLLRLAPGPDTPAI
jgi:hypothetical protein